MVTRKGFENRIMRRVLGPKRDETGEWRRPHNEKLHILCCSRNKVRVIKSIKLRWGGHVGRMEEDRSLFKILTGKPTGKSLTWEDLLSMEPWGAAIKKTFSVAVPSASVRVPSQRPLAVSRKSLWSLMIRLIMK